MNTVTLSVEVPLSDLTPESVRAAVIEAAVDRLFEADPFEDSPFMRTMREQVRQKVGERVTAVVDARVPAIVDDVLTAKFQPFDPWGEARGEETTLRQMIYNRAHRWLSESIDSSGQTHGSNRRPRIHWLVAGAVEDCFKKELATEVKKAADEVRAALVGKVSAEITKTVSALLKLG